jgi:hypothetical protein
MGGLFNLAYAIVTGVVMARVRGREPAVPKYLSFAHVGPLMWGPILLSMVIAINFGDLSDGWKTGAAALLVAGSVALGVKDTLNWLQGIKDEFVERPPGLALGGISAVLFTAGLVIVIVGDAQAL